MKLVSVERKVLAGLVVVFFAALVAGISAYRGASFVFSDQLWLAPSMATIEGLDDLLQSDFELNSAWVSYQLEPQEELGVRIDQLKRIISAQFVNLEKSANGSQKERIALLRSVTQRVLESFGEGGKFDRETSPLAIRADIQRLQEVQSGLRAIKHGELNGFRNRLAGQNSQIRDSLIIVSTTVVIQFCVMGFLFWLGRGDMIERRRMEEGMRRNKEELTRARDAAIAAAQIKSQFLANMSHEIRTPMNGVLGMTEIILDTPLSPRQREFAETIQSSANALLAIIDDILDFSKIEAGMLRFERASFNLHTTLEGVIDLFVQAARKKGLELAYLIEEHVPVMVAGDASRLRQVLTNLLSNAIKFTEAGEVVLRASLTSEIEGITLVRFEVSDTGIGLSEKDQTLLFNPFVQADASMTRHFGGTGLGLSISKQLVNGMGGEIGSTSTLGTGSIFWFTVKLGVGEALSQNARREGDLRNARVLLVDDNATNRKILHYQVSAWGMRDSVASSGPAALNLLRKGTAFADPFSIMILDGHMPELSGLQVVELIRADPTLSALKIVLLTSVEPGDFGEAWSGQVDAFLAKPVKETQLFETLCRVAGVGNNVEATMPDEPARTPSKLLEKKLRILLAEDNEVNQRVILYRLRMLEQHADLARDGIAALKLYDENEYDAILMDIQMPKLDGYLVTAEIRSRELRQNRRRTWIIATTANAMPADRERCIEAGMDDHLAKPIQARALVKALENYLTNSSQSLPPSNSQSLLPATNLRFLVESGLADMVPELVAVFLEWAPLEIKKMESAYDAGDAKGVADAAHSLKGSSSNLGTANLQELCHQIETQGRSGTLEGVSVLMTALAGEFDRVRTELLFCPDLSCQPLSSNTQSNFGAPPDRPED
jgi:two-component system sensor histidine kinase/response regulator